MHSHLETSERAGADRVGHAAMRCQLCTAARRACALCVAALLPLSAGCGKKSSAAPVAPETIVSTPAVPQSIDTGGIAFAEVARERGLSHVWPRQPRPMSIRDAFGCGCAAFDYDNDGWQDVLLVASPQPMLYRNLGNGNFKNVTEQSGLSGAACPGGADRRAFRQPLARRRLETRQWSGWTGVAIGDFDADGWLDVLLTGFQCLALFKNDGGAFRDVTSPAGLDAANHRRWGASAGFMDLDGDSLLDLVILNYLVFGSGSQQFCELAPGVRSACPPQRYARERGEIWRNTGRGTFELAPEVSGMGATNGAAMVLAFTDLDDDNRPDFYIGNDGPRADFMRNDGALRFTNIAAEIGVAVGHEWLPTAAMGADWADFNRDGLLDLTVTDFQKSGFSLFRHSAHEIDCDVAWHGFEQVANQTGISAATRERLGFGAKWLDMDNDGWPDLCYANGHVYDNAGKIQSGERLRQPPLLLRNEQGRRFVDLAPVLDSALTKPIVGRGSATADFNNDGRVDVLIVDHEGPPLLLENRSRTENHWITFDLRGAEANRFAYGARVTVRAQHDVWVGEVSPASSYLSSSDPRIHFGLGKLTTLENVTIRWPSGHMEDLRDLPADQIVRVVEGRASADTRAGSP